jgi:hypothetical protein
VTKHGKPTVVVVAAEEYKRLQHLEALEAPNFVDHLLSIPADDGKFARLKRTLRTQGIDMIKIACKLGIGVSVVQRVVNAEARSTQLR